RTRSRRAASSRAIVSSSTCRCRSRRWSQCRPARASPTHSVVFGGFSAKSVQERIIDAGAVAVITADGQFRGGKEIPLKPVVDEALAMGGCEAIKSVLVYKRSGSKVPMSAGRDTWWEDAVKGQADTCEPTF